MDNFKPEVDVVVEETMAEKYRAPDYSSLNDLQLTTLGGGWAETIL